MTAQVETETQPLFAFDGLPFAPWCPTDDGVMGGRSRSQFAPTAAGTAAFTGVGSALRVAGARGVAMHLGEEAVEEVTSSYLPPGFVDIARNKAVDLGGSRVIQSPSSTPRLGLPAPTTGSTRIVSPRVPGPTIDPVGGFEVGQFISTPNGLLSVPKGGSWNVKPNGVDIHSYYPNGSNAYRINPAGHPNNPTPHMHLHQPGTGPGMKGQGPSLDINGTVVPWNSAGAHWPL